jgi:membrane protein YdbS with pleckstrin-like domain
LQTPSAKEVTIRRIETALRFLFFLSIVLFSVAVVYFAQVESRNWQQKVFLVLLLPLALTVTLNLIRKRLLRSDSL